MSVNKEVMTETEAFETLTSIIEELVFTGSSNFQKLRAVSKELNKYQWPRDETEEQIIRDALTATSQIISPHDSNYPTIMKRKRTTILNRFLNTYTDM